jgi:hypothetical protein
VSDLYYAGNFPMQTTAGPAPVTTGTSIKTMLQVQTPSTQAIRVVAWSVSFSGTAAGTPVVCELVETGSVAATVTAHVAAGVQPYSNASAPASLVTLGTTATGYTSTSEGTVTATRTGDVQQVAPTNQYTFVWPLAREFYVPAGRNLRIRVTAAAAVNMLCSLIWDE